VVIISSVSLAQYETAWAAILVASVLGILFYGAIALIERLVLSWDPTVRVRNE
jgi:NitT/TauT family transport system permease protein